MVDPAFLPERGVGVEGCSLRKITKKQSLRAEAERRRVAAAKAGAGTRTDVASETAWWLDGAGDRHVRWVQREVLHAAAVRPETGVRRCCLGTAATTRTDKGPWLWMWRQARQFWLASEIPD